MTVTSELTKELKIDGGDDSYVANEDLSSSQFRVVVFAAQSSGKAKVGLPGGQGVYPAGVLLNTPASGEIAQVRHRGISKVVANGAFDSGIEVTIAATTGKIEAAASGDYVVGRSREASAEANHEVSINQDGTYQKN